MPTPVNVPLIPHSDEVFAFARLHSQIVPNHPSRFISILQDYKLSPPPLCLGGDVCSNKTQSANLSCPPDTQINPSPDGLHAVPRQSRGTPQISGAG